jgi:hypothetical protein
MPGLVPGIHVFIWGAIKGVDGRDKPGHDGDHAHSNQIRNDVFCIDASDAIAFDV